MQKRTITAGLPTAQLEWRDGVPYSSEYGDIYFSADDGLAESEYVFLRHNGLPQRWRDLSAALQPFVICETGFGTGLNFLLTVQQWLQHRPANRRLHYIAIEHRPLKVADLRQALRRWPGFAPLVDALVSQYPPAIRGPHRLHFWQWGVTLDLIFDDAETALAELRAVVDAWFLDGFAPAKNGSMWAENSLLQIGRLSNESATFSTFTAAGVVKRGLQTAGFKVEKVRGFGRKRDMLCGHLLAAPASGAGKPWLATARDVETNSRIAVIGGGLAGSAVARALAERGYAVDVFDSNPQPAAASSGNPIALLQPPLARRYDRIGEWALTAWAQCERELGQLLAAGHRIDHERCGSLHIATQADQPAFFEQLVAELSVDESLLATCDAEQATAIAGIAIDKPALQLPTALWLQPAQLCAARLAHPNIEWHGGQQLERLTVEADGKVSLLTRNKTHSADRVVLANAAGSMAFRPWLRLQQGRGQLSAVASTETSRALRSILNYRGHVLPAIAGKHWFGASSARLPEQQRGAMAVLPVELSEHQQNIDQLAKLGPTVLQALGLPGADHCEGRAAARCKYRDHLPMVGPLPNQKDFAREFAGLEHGRLQAKAGQLEPDTQLADSPVLGSLAMGARGVSYSSLAAELIASQLAAEPLPIGGTLCDAVHPARALVTAMRQATK